MARSQPAICSGLHSNSSLPCTAARSPASVLSRVRRGVELVLGRGATSAMACHAGRSVCAHFDPRFAARPADVLGVQQDRRRGSSAAVAQSLRSSQTPRSRRSGRGSCSVVLDVVPGSPVLRQPTFSCCAPRETPPWPPSSAPSRASPWQWSLARSPASPSSDAPDADPRCGSGRPHGRRRLHSLCWPHRAATTRSPGQRPRAGACLGGLAGTVTLVITGMVTLVGDAIAPVLLATALAVAACSWSKAPPPGPDPGRNPRNPPEQTARSPPRERGPTPRRHRALPRSAPSRQRRCARSGSAPTTYSPRRRTRPSETD